jgi:hypothetical protein
MIVDLPYWKKIDKWRLWPRESGMASKIQWFLCLLFGTCLDDQPPASCLLQCEQSRPSSFWLPNNKTISEEDSNRKYEMIDQFVRMVWWRTESPLMFHLLEQSPSSMCPNTFLTILEWSRRWGWPEPNHFLHWWGRSCAWRPPRQGIWQRQAY